MSRVFGPTVNLFVNLTIAAVAFSVVFGTLAAYAYLRSDYSRGTGLVPPQPVPFSHEHHVSGLGLDCRYCHATAEYSDFAGMPATAVCMNCHSQVWRDAPMLEPVRQSFFTDRPLAWSRIDRMPQFVYFSHQIHLAKGIGCSTCHGDVQNMPLTFKAQALYMKWCVDCHSDPSKYIRPRGQVFNMHWKTPDDQAVVGPKLVKEYGVRTRGLTDCSTCHR